MLSDDLPSGWGKGCGCNQLGDSKDFDTDSHNIFLGKTAAHGLGRCTLCWFKNCLAGQAQRVSWKELHPAVGWPQMVFLKAQYWGQSCVASLLIIWTKELHSSPQKTLNWGSVDLLEGKKALQRDLDSCIGSQKYKVHIYSSVLGPTSDSVLLGDNNPRNCLEQRGQKTPWQKRTGGCCLQLSKCEPKACPGGPKSQWHCGLHQQ